MYKTYDSTIYELSSLTSIRHGKTEDFNLFDSTETDNSPINTWSLEGRISQHYYEELPLLLDGIMI